MINIVEPIHITRGRHYALAIMLATTWLIMTSVGAAPLVYAAEMQPQADNAVVNAIAAGTDHTCEIKSGGVVACWGAAEDGQSTPPPGIFTQVSLGELHSCGLKSDNTLACWGSVDTEQSVAPSGVFQQVSAGAEHNCAIHTAGDIICWGDDFEGVVPTGAFLQISAGDFHTCGIRSDKTLVCWGEDEEGASIPPAGAFTAVSAGGYHNCAIRETGDVACWGENDQGQATPPAGTFSQISAGSAHTCGIKTDSTLVCWGDGENGQTAAPAGAFIGLSAGDEYNCAIRSDGTVVCWGINDEGQAPVIQLNPTVLPRAQAGVAYGQTISATALNYAVVAPRFDLAAGLLPTGLSLDPVTGILSGVPSVPGAYPVVIRAIDTNNLSGQQAYTIIINTPPIANDQSITLAQDTARVLSLTASDGEGDALTYLVVSQPAHGALSGTAPNLVYTPSSGYTGVDSFTFKANDGLADSNVATVNITVLAGQLSNIPPIANSQNIRVLRNAAENILLTASDADANPITYAVVTPPAHGTLSGTPPNLIYQPTIGYMGSDSFTFKANDGSADSNLATVSITVIEFNTPPVANDLQVITLRDVAVAFLLTASDAENDPLGFTIISNPTIGSLSGTPPNLTYTPNAGVFGTDSFTFKVNDGTADSNVGTVTITISPVLNPPNIRPIANAQNISMTRNQSRSVTLTGSDAENAALVFTLVDNPTHGQLSGVAPNLTYQPFAGYVGMDSFTFKVSDGDLESTLAMVNINVIAFNTTPIANSQTTTTGRNQAKNITLTATDADSDLLTYTLLSQPTHGTLSGSAPNLIYTPQTDFFGLDTFTFQVNDGQADSNPATVTINVTEGVGLNSAPTANNQTVGIMQGTAKEITLSASDADHNPLTYVIVSQPAHGTLGGVAPILTYTPQANFFGTDSFTFKVNDGQADSNTATVTLNVAANTAQGSVTGIIYNDKNGDSQKNGTDVGLAGITVILSDATVMGMNSNAVSEEKAERSTTTDADGIFRFDAVPAGTYTLRINLPAGYATAGAVEFEIEVSANGETTVPPFALHQTGSTIFLPLIRR